MSPLAWGIIGIGILIYFLITGVPVAISMLAAGLIGIICVDGLNTAFTMTKLVPYAATASYSMVPLPLFILMGEFAATGGLSEEGYRFMHKLLGHRRGGVAMATIAGCAAFAAVCGSSVAAAATMGTVALPEMIRYKTDKSLAAGTVCAGGTIGILIPPSIGFIVYAIITEQSIGKLFLAGILPGILISIIFMLLIYILTLFKPELSPAAERAPFKDIMVAGSRSWGIIVLFILVIGGIYVGVFTPTEAAAIGAFGAFTLSLVKRKLTWQKFWTALLGAGRVTGMILVIVIGAYMFGYFLTISQVASEISSFVANLDVGRYTILVLIIFFYAGLGCIMEVIAGMLITLPIIYPIILTLGFDPIWFGVIVVVVMEMGLITPPVGLNVFTVAGVARHIPITAIYLGVFPFVGAMIACLILLILFPQISLFLPSLIY
jgi:tripartite ATP-independent transporter DctM subunit